MMDFELFNGSSLNTRKLFTPKRMQRILTGKEKTNFPSELLPFVQFMANDCDYRLTKCYIHDNRLFIHGGSVFTKKRNELMLRLNFDGYGYVNSLIVARIEFVNRRTGNMTNLYNLLKAFQVCHQTGPIIIENAMGEGMIRWCEKNSFYEIIKRTYIEPAAIETSNIGLRR